MIDINKKYRTRDGREARVICTDVPGDQPVIALHAAGNVTYHNADGHWLFDGAVSDNDLIEVREPRVIWVNEYEDFDFQVYDNEKEAKENADACAIRTAVKYIEAV